ncbi:hypothetical protein JCM18899A_13830 [Nocardioides sp. AN3]
MSIVAETATVAHGYTMAEIDSITQQAIYGYKWTWTVLDASDRWDCAWHAIVELLYSTTEKPTRWSLVNAAQKAITAEVNAYFRHHGISKDEEAPNHGKFWRPIVGPRPDFTDGLAERLALPQVLGQLTDLQYEAIATLAIHGTIKNAAAASGVPYAIFIQRVKAARRVALEAWFAPETPVRRGKGNADQCRYGHARAEHGYITPAGIWRCRVCSRNAARRRAAAGGTR